MRFLRHAELKASIALAKALSSWSASALKRAFSSVLPSMCASAGKLCTPVHKGGGGAERCGALEGRPWREAAGGGSGRASFVHVAIKTRAG